MCFRMMSEIAQPKFYVVIDNCPQTNVTSFISWSVEGFVRTYEYDPDRSAALVSFDANNPYQLALNQFSRK